MGAINPLRAQFSSGTLTTGHYQIETNSTLATPDIGNITINQASITLLTAAGSIWTNINNLTNNQGSFTITHGRNFLASAPFSNSGTLTVGPHSTFEAASPFTNTGTIDVAGGTFLQLDQGLAASTIIAQLHSGFANGAWNGPGIISSLAATHPGTAVGYIVSGTTYTLDYTWLGDTNLDGLVNNADLMALIPGKTNATWAQGDFNYDGIVNADDYTLFMLGAADSNGANILTTVPEPACAALLIVALVLSPRRKKNRVIFADHAPHRRTMRRPAQFSRLSSPGASHVHARFLCRQSRSTAGLADLRSVSPVACDGFL